MLPLALVFGGPQDLVIIAIVVLLLFGGSKVGGFMKSLGQGVKEFKNEIREDEPTAAPAQPVVVSKPEEK